MGPPPPPPLPPPQPEPAEETQPEPAEETQPEPAKETQAEPAKEETQPEEAYSAPSEEKTLETTFTTKKVKSLPRMKLKKEKEETSELLKSEKPKAYMSDFEKSRELWSHKMANKNIPIRVPKTKPKLDEAKEEERRQHQTKQEEYRRIVQEQKAIKKKSETFGNKFGAGRGRGGFGRGGGRNIPEERTDIHSRLRKQKDNMRLRRLGLDTAKRLEEKERMRKKDARIYRPRTISATPVTAVGAALQNHADKAQRTAAKKQGRAVRKKVILESKQVPQIAKISSLLRQQQEKDEAAGKSLPVSAKKKLKVKKEKAVTSKQKKKSKQTKQAKKKKKKKELEEPSDFFTKFLHMVGSWILLILSLFSGGAIASPTSLKSKKVSTKAKATKKVEAVSVSSKNSGRKKKRSKGKKK